MSSPTPAQIADALLHADHALSGESMMAARHLQALATAYRSGQSDLEKARADLERERESATHRERIMADEARASLAAMEGENKRLRAELVSPASGETWERLARGHEIVASQRGEEIEQLHGQLRRARKAAACGWSAWLENVLAEIDEARASENDEYADELVEVLRPLQAALSGETHGK